MTNEEVLVHADEARSILKTIWQQKHRWLGMFRQSIYKIIAAGVNKLKLLVNFNETEITVQIFEFV